MKALQFYLFGRFRVCSSGTQHMTGFEGRKVQELFCYLLFHRSRPYARDYLANLLWNGEPETRARGYLRKALWQLQGALVNKAESSVESPMLEADAESIKLKPIEECWLDIDIFEQSYNAVKAVSGNRLDADKAHAIENAESLYQGEVLEGWDQDWCICERERYHYMYLSMMDKLLDYCESCQAYERGIDYGMRILSFDHLHERTYQKLMRLHYLAGDRTSALQEYSHCAESLIDELGVCPGQQTKLLYQQILDDRLEKAITSQGDSRKEANGELAHILDRLDELRATLGDLQAQVEREIAVLEDSLSARHH